jgi:hypothetical protein
MPPRRLMRAFLALWIVTGAVLLIASVETLRGAWEGARHANPHIVLLGGVEAVAAALFLIPRAMRLGATGLLATIAVAFLVHTALGEFRGDLLLYGAAVAFVAIHGTLTPDQFRAAVGRTTA